jgi:hypothetical protein
VQHFKNLKGYGKRSGLSTVEMAMVFPVVLMLILVLMGLLYFFARGAYLQAIVDDALKHSATIVAQPTGQFESGALSAESLHQSFLFAKTMVALTSPLNNPNDLTRIKLDAYVTQKLEFYKSALNPKANLSVVVTSKQFVFFKKVRIEIFDCEDSAFSKIYVYFSQQGPPPIAAGEIMIGDTPEMIRTVDYASEFAVKLKVVKTLSAQLEKARVVIMNFIENPTGD